MILNSPYITGSLTVTGNTTLQGALTVTGSLSGTAATASFALTLGGTGSVGFATTGAFTATSGSASSRLTQIEQVYATTGSNSFRATQSITGSLTVTGQIIAQTLNVQQVTSSIVFSSGSNVFGCDLNSRQTFTGSVLMTGSLIVNTTGPELQVTNNGVVMGNLLADNHRITGSLNITGSTHAIFGNVGIGTTSPLVPLDVSSLNSGGIAANLVIRNSASGNASGNQGSGLYFLADNGYSVANNTAAIFALSNTRAQTNGGADLYFATHNNSSGPTNKMVIQSGGNVGIGTTTVCSRLSVFESSGTTTSTAEFITQGNAVKGRLGMFANNFYASHNWFYNGSQNVDNSAIGLSNITFANNGSLEFGTAPAGANVPQMRLTLNAAGGFGSQLCNFCLTGTYQTLITVENGSYGLLMLSSCLGGGTYALYNIYNNAGVTSVNLIHGNNIPACVVGNAVRFASANSAIYCDMRSSYIRFY